MVERKTITVNEDVSAVIAKAAEMWPELSHNYSILVGKIVVDWDRIRANGDGRTDKLHREIAELQAAVAALSPLPSAMMRLEEEVAKLRNGSAFILSARDNGCDSVAGFDDHGMEIDGQ